MSSFSKLRIVALVILGLGTLQLGTATAAAPTAPDPCDDEVLPLAIGACDEMTGGEWDYLEVSCEYDEIYVNCISEQ